MRPVIYLNRWNDMIHLMRAVVVNDTTHRRLESRFCLSLEDARTQAEQWVEEYHVAVEDVHDNTGIDLDILFAHIEIDLNDVAEAQVAGLVG
jgi:hypothetical protein